MAAAEATRTVQRCSRSVVARVLAANLVGAILSSVLPVSPPSSTPADAVVSVAVFAAFIALTFSGAAYLLTVATRAALAWLPAQREPSAVERRRILLLPWIGAGIALAAWVASAFVFAGLRLARDTLDREGAAILGVRNLLIGLTAASISFLLVERRLRPFFSAALAGPASGPVRTVGLRSRFALTWLMGSAVPLVVYGGAFLGKDLAERGDIAGAGWIFVVGGLATGAVAVLFAARSVAEPLDAVRRAMAQVEAGALDVEVPVDDGTEIGRVQAGFNRMVAGLRERQRLHDLFGRHVGEEVALRALERGVHLGGEQVEASALFVDLMGSTSYAEHRSADEVVSTLNEFFAVVVSAVAAEGGWVNKFEGDAALCVFGPPAGHPDHAMRALRAARSMRAALDRWKEAYPELDAGVGVASGVVVAGNVGAEDRYEYTIIGDPVNQAARITELAKDQPGRLLASASAIDCAADEAAAWVEVDRVTLRGRSAPTVLYGIRDHRGP